MGVLTEASLRDQFRSEVPKVYTISPKTIVTPSARQFLNEKGVKVIYEEGELQDYQEADKGGSGGNRETEGNVYEPLEVPDKRIVPKYVDYYTGGAYEEKPEYMTHIYGNKLVYKDDCRIIFRGKLDSYESLLLETMVYTHKQDLKELTEELGEVLAYVRLILRGEVLNEQLSDMKVLGLDEAMLREQSHHPKKYFGILHIMPSFNMGETLIRLNTLRSTAREVEIAGLQAFKHQHQVERKDILQALNRLSSVIYIMMCREKAGKYKRKQSEK